MNKPASLLSTALWIWVAGSLAAYLFQFRNLLAPILSLLKLQ